MLDRWNSNPNMIRFDNNIILFKLDYGRVTLVYSYETCVAIKRGVKVYLLGYYSRTTSKHLNAYIDSERPIKVVEVNDRMIGIILPAVYNFNIEEVDRLLDMVDRD